MGGWVDIWGICQEREESMTVACATYQLHWRCLDPLPSLCFIAIIMCSITNISVSPFRRRVNIHVSFFHPVCNYWHITSFMLSNDFILCVNSLLLLNLHQNATLHYITLQKKSFSTDAWICLVFNTHAFQKDVEKAYFLISFLFPLYYNDSVCIDQTIGLY